MVVCDHIGWNSSEIISPLVSLGCSLSADQNIRGLLQGEHPEILAQSDTPPVDLSVGDIRSQIAAEWLQIAHRSQWRAYRKLPSLFRMTPLLTTYDLPYPQNGGSICPQDMRMAISPQRVIRYTSCSVNSYGRVFGDGGSNGAISGSNKSKMAAATILEKFKWPYLHNPPSNPLHLWF